MSMPTHDGPDGAASEETIQFLRNQIYDPTYCDCGACLNRDAGSDVARELLREHPDRSDAVAEWLNRKLTRIAAAREAEAMPAFEDPFRPMSDAEYERWHRDYAWGLGVSSDADAVRRATWLFMVRRKREGRMSESDAEARGEAR